MRIAFTLINSSSWTGGYNYLLNLLRTLLEYQADKIHPILFYGENALDTDLHPFKELANLELVQSRVFNDSYKSIRLLNSLLFGRDSFALSLFRQHRIDVCFENAMFYGWRFPIPSIAWMPDFQHRHLREQFSYRAYWRRELGFQIQVFSGRFVMLSSEDARKDCENFYPGATGRTAVVRFAAPIPTELLEKFPEQVLDKYQLPPTFFYLPNQFWKHKNHLVVIEALGLLKQQGKEIVVAASGNPLDNRHPEYLFLLKERIAALNLQQNFRMLGLIPRPHVFSLMRSCTALINPSFFEGWSSTVEEAKTLGIPMILSDIAVHREQVGNGAHFFNPDDALSLVRGLENFVMIDKRLQSDFSQKLQNDVLCQFANDFYAIAEKAAHSLNS